MVKIYQVGGFIRDEILGVKSKDIDYSVEASSFQEMKDYIISSGGEIFLETPEYVTIRARFGKETADYVLCRKEGRYSDGRHPDQIEIGTLYDDLARRDFTMNAIAKDSDGNYIDPFNGTEDIKNKIIRCVGKTEDRIREDWLRLLRAARFSITKEMFIDQSILKFFGDNYATSMLYKTVSEERIREEVYKMFKADTRASIQFFADYHKMAYACFGGNIWLEPTTKEK